MIKNVDAAYRYINCKNKKMRRRALAMIRQSKRDRAKS